MARRHRPLFPLPCPRRNRYAPSSSSQSPLSSVSAWRRKLRPLPCSSSPNRTRLRWASIWLAALPPFGRKPFWFGKIKKLGPYRRAFARRYGPNFLIFPSQDVFLPNGGEAATQIEAQRKRVRFGEEEQGSGRSFRRQAETELSGLCKKSSRIRRRSRQPNRSPAQAGSIWRGDTAE